MIKIGKTYHLAINASTQAGAFLDGENLGEVFLPSADLPEIFSICDKIEVFLYRDDNDVIATTIKPKIQLGQFAYLRVVGTSRVGAFIDWGLGKDLFVPFSEQRHKMQANHWYVVCVYLQDSTNRLAASSKVEKFLSKYPPTYKTGEPVNILIYERTELGFKAIINNTHQGLLYHSEIFREVNEGDAITAYVNKVRDDNKIDLILEKSGFQSLDALQEKILDFLQQHQGYMAISDKSSAELIKKVFGVSKKKFKMALGGLYKQRLISINEDGVKLEK